MDEAQEAAQLEVILAALPANASENDIVVATHGYRQSAVTAAIIGMAGGGSGFVPAAEAGNVVYEYTNAGPVADGAAVFAYYQGDESFQTVGPGGFEVAPVEDGVYAYILTISGTATGTAPWDVRLTIDGYMNNIQLVTSVRASTSGARGVVSGTFWIAAESYALAEIAEPVGAGVLTDLELRLFIQRLA